MKYTLDLAYNEVGYKEQISSPDLPDTVGF